MEFEKIRNVIAEILDVEPDEITEEMALEELDADSLDLFQILTELEDVFGVEITTEETEQIRTAGDIANLIRNMVPKL
ncbi:MAG: acyl carrier protein [Clostridiales bacterium]|nr:acyl carrier protein [Clostridiales bacterium]MCD8109201.1 acyl carrier protein [Clostridiales bacterium]MCD8133352.1 acyl carrier protein [Clostridiales bacterium]